MYVDIVISNVFNLNLKKQNFLWRKCSKFSVNAFGSAGMGMGQHFWVGQLWGWINSGGWDSYFRWVNSGG